MKKHYNNKYNQILKILTKDGFTCKPPGGGGKRGGATKKGNKFFIYKEDGPKILIHSGGDDFGHLKRQLKNDYGYLLIK